MSELPLYLLNYKYMRQIFFVKAETKYSHKNPEHERSEKRLRNVQILHKQWRMFGEWKEWKKDNKVYDNNDRKHNDIRGERVATRE